MGVTLTADLDLLGFRAVLGAYGAAARDLTPLMEQVGALLETSTADRIRDTNVAPDGVAWPKSMRAEEDGGKTLLDRGRVAAANWSVTAFGSTFSARVGIIPDISTRTALSLAPATSRSLKVQDGLNSKTLAC